MMRWTPLLGAVVVVFSLTFVAARLSAAPEPAAAPQLAVAPTGAGAPLAVRTLRGVAPLPRLRLAISAPAGVPAAPPSRPPVFPVPPPPGSSPTRPPAERLCARAAWLLPTGGASASPRTGRC